MDTHHEIERTFDVPPGTTLPDLAAVDGVAAITDPDECDLETTYFDTADLRLTRRGTALRRRVGGKDQGWHLKVRLDAGRRANSWLPLGTATAVPAPLVREVRAVARGLRLAPVAAVRTTRVERRLLRADGTAVALLIDDTVRTDPGDTAARSAWRELSIELLDPGTDLLDTLTALLGAAGIHRSRHVSKLERALGPRYPRRQPCPVPGPREPAGALVVAGLRCAVEEVVGGDPGVRADVPEAVHRMRMAVHRVRGVLASFRPLFDPVAVDALREELGWLGTALGRLRDADVMRRRLGELLAAQPVELVGGVHRERVDADIDEAHRRIHTDLLGVLDDERYFQLLEALDGLIVTPPLVPRAGRPATRVLPALVARANRRVAAAAAAAEKAAAAPAPAPAARYDRLLHQVRKRAKRARYAGEYAAGVLDERAVRLAGRMREIHEVLGEREDSLLTRAALRELSRRAHQQGEDGFGLGLLHGLEHGRGEAAMREYRRIVRAARRDGWDR